MIAARPALVQGYQAYAKLIVGSRTTRRTRYCEENKHQKDNRSHSGIFWTLQGMATFYSMFLLKSVVSNGATPQVASEPERSCRETRGFLIRVPAVFSSGAEPWGLPGLRSSGAFTLIEVVIAVGLVAFVLTAILGLVAIAANETKNADLKARLAWITEQVTSEYQSQRFSNALARVPTNSALDYEGMPVLTNSATAYFICDVSNVTPSNSPSYPTNYIALLQVRTRWPSPQLTSTNVSVISLFNYQ
jgi:uncharacterized protein (TIGR02598 family)